MTHKTQFARLLAEISAVGLTTQQTTDLEKSMDLHKDTVNEIKA